MKLAVPFVSPLGWALKHHGGDCDTNLALILDKPIDGFPGFGFGFWWRGFDIARCILFRASSLLLATALNSKLKLTPQREGDPSNKRKVMRMWCYESGNQRRLRVRRTLLGPTSCVFFFLAIRIAYEV